MKFKQKLVLGFGLFFLLYVVALIISSTITLRSSFERVYDRELNNITESIYQTAYSAYLGTQQQVNSNLNVAQHFVEGRSYLRQGEQLTFIIENQITHETKEKRIPAMYVDNNIGISERVSKNNALVNYITDRIGGTVTIFQLIDEGLLRVSTSVIRADSSRAIGTFIPTDSPVYKTITSGEVYQGRAYVVNDWYVTAYSPIIEGDSIIGALYVGVKQSNLTVLNQVIKSFKLGKTYYPYIFTSTGNVVIHPFIEQGNILNVQDAEGRYFIHDLVKEIKEEKQFAGVIEYNWEHEVTGEMSERLIYFRYLPQMDWIIAVGIEKEEIYMPMNRQINTSIVIALILAVIVFFFIILLGRSFTRQLERLDEGMKRFSNKEFDVRVPVRTKDEIGRMAATFNTMADQLKSLYRELDSKVRERTKKISQQNIRLKQQKDEIEKSREELLSTNDQLHSLNTALFESERKYRRLIENLREEYIFYSQKPDGTYTYVSPSVKNVLGYNVEEAGEGLLKFSTDNAVNDEAEKMTRLSRMGSKQQPFQIELRDNEGRHKWFEVTEIPVFDAKGLIVAVEGIAKDITDYVAAEDALRELNATKDKFFSIIAHDLKNPFNSLLAFTEYLVDDFEEISPEEMKEHLETLNESAQKGYKLLENLLQWSRVQTGRINKAPRILNLRSAATEGIEPLEGTAEGKKIKLKNDIPGNIKVFSDKNMLVTVVRNIVSNAIKYSYEGGEVITGAEKKDDKVITFISDRGTGISKEAQEKLFRIDSDYSTPGTQEESGSGLGLILSRDFIRENKGDIWLESEPGKGSTFYFSLPAAE